MKRLRERRIYALVLAVSFVAAMPIPALFTTGADPDFLGDLFAVASVVPVTSTVAWWLGLGIGGYRPRLGLAVPLMLVATFLALLIELALFGVLVTHLAATHSRWQWGPVLGRLCLGAYLSVGPALAATAVFFAWRAFLPPPGATGHARDSGNPVTEGSH